MSGNAGTLEQLALFLGEVLEGLAKPLASPELLFAELGFAPPEDFLSGGGPAGALATAASSAADLAGAVANLRVAIDADDSGAISIHGVESLAKIGSLLQSLPRVASSINDSAQSSATFTPAQKAAVHDFANNLPGRLLGRLVADLVFSRAPNFLAVLSTAGLLDIQTNPGIPGDPIFPEFAERAIRLDRLGQMLSNPLDYLKATFGFGLPTFDGTALFERITTLFDTRLERCHLDAGPGKPSVLETPKFRLFVDPAVTPPCLSYSLRLGVNEPVSLDVNLSDAWSLSLQMDAKYPGESTLRVLSSGEVALVPPSGTASLNFTLTLKTRQPGRPFTILGLTGATRLTAETFALTIGINAPWDAGRASAVAEPMFGVALGNLTAVLDPSGGDAFIGQLLGSSQRNVSVSLAPVLTPSLGLRFDGSSTIEIAIPTHAGFGPVSVDTVYISGKLDGDTIPIELSVAARGQLGPLSALADRIGVIVEASFPPGGGNLGPLNLGLRFKPPNGIGLSLDAGIITGGGFLYIDADRGEYAGALELVFSGFLGLHAVGIISTRLPDGSKGFSLLIIITADFGPGIQLGFGFTLLAVGGLLGLNRAMLFQPLMDSIRSGAIESIMFPRDVVANAMRIISDLRTIFPPQEGTFLVGPMAKLGWGEPTLISLSLGVIVEIPPGDIAILGILKLALPAEDVPILLLQVNFAGALEFDKQRAFFFASLFDSHLLFMTLEGDMGVLMAFGSNANFVVSVGGFHPQFVPPPLPFPTPRRIELDIINESFARIRSSGYFAVTSNTCQFGSFSEYFFGFSACNIQGHSGFDALFIFSPFHFTVTISTSFSVNVFDVGVYGVGIDLTLSGPSRWHASGSASLSFFLFSVDIGIDFTWGEDRDTNLPAIALMPLLAGEYAKQSNWRAILPPGSNLLVSLRQLDAAEAATVLHPVGTLQVSQRAIPLDLTLDKVGNQAPSDAKRFGLTVNSAGLAAVRTLQEQFAAAQFENLPDAVKLSMAAYSPMDSGLDLSAKGNAYGSGTAITCNVRYDLSIIDTSLRRLRKRFFVLVGSLFMHFLKGSSVAHNTLSAFQKAQTQPFTEKVAVAPESFVVALTSNNQVFHPEAASFTSQLAARDYLARKVAADPSLDSALHVIPGFEVAA